MAHSLGDRYMRGEGGIQRFTMLYKTIMNVFTWDFHVKDVNPEEEEVWT